jgi:BASS family bile acid:Na+ symporter
LETGAFGRYRIRYSSLQAGGVAVTADRLINLLAAVTLIEMMVTIGLGVNVSDVFRVATNPGLVMRAALANYILVPAAAIALLLAFHASPMVAAGFLVAAVCPGAPYGPPFTGMAKGNVAVSVGLMVILAGSSAILAPVLLQFLLPFIAGDAQLKMNVGKMVATLLGAQLVPLCVGLALHSRYPALADELRKPAGVASVLLNLLTLAVIIFVQFRILAHIRVGSYLGMLCLVLATMMAGWVTGGSKRDERKSMMLTTSVRNVGVSLVIVTSSFPGTPAITAATAYALLQTIALALVASAWGRVTSASEAVNAAKAA